MSEYYIIQIWDWDLSEWSGFEDRRYNTIKDAEARIQAFAEETSTFMRTEERPAFLRIDRRFQIGGRVVL